ncbi:hypothetical protein BH23PLA1_BH23PLA1_31670 [soil metagenome]
MRRGRRGGRSVLEFDGSGADSFVAVVVTKLTGALLFILLLAMVIMALLPKAIDDRLAAGPGEAQDSLPLAIATPEVLPEAIAGRPYTLALATTGGRGPLQWALDGPLPEGLDFDPQTAMLHGTPSAGTPGPVSLVLRVSDGQDRATRQVRLVVYAPDQPLTVPSKWDLGLPPIPLRVWLEQGVGFLVLLLVHMVGMNALAALQHRATLAIAEGERSAIGRRFAFYRGFVRLATLSCAVVLAAWLWAIL